MKNGNGYLLDTNAIIQFLKGNAELVSVLADADFIATSIIAEMEYFSFPRLGEEDVRLYHAFMFTMCRPTTRCSRNLS